MYMTILVIIMGVLTVAAIVKALLWGWLPKRAVGWSHIPDTDGSAGHNATQGKKKREDRAGGEHDRVCCRI